MDPNLKPNQNDLIKPSPTFDKSQFEPLNPNSNSLNNLNTYCLENSPFSDHNKYLKPDSQFDFSKDPYFGSSPLNAKAFLNIINTNPMKQNSNIYTHR